MASNIEQRKSTGHLQPPAKEPTESSEANAMGIRSFGKQRSSCWDWYLRGSPHSGSASSIPERRFLHTFTRHKDSYEAPTSLSRLEPFPPWFTEGFRMSPSDCFHPVSHVSFTLGKEAHKKIEGVIRNHSLCVVVSTQVLVPSSSQHFDSGGKT